MADDPVLIVAVLAVDYLAGRIRSWRNLEDWVGDHFPANPDARPWWQQPFLWLALWIFHPVTITRHTIRHMRGLPMVEVAKRAPASEIGDRQATTERPESAGGDLR